MNWWGAELIATNAELLSCYRKTLRQIFVNIQWMFDEKNTPLMKIILQKIFEKEIKDNKFREDKAIKSAISIGIVEACC